jgi:hypothetical protein
MMASNANKVVAHKGYHYSISATLRVHNNNPVWTATVDHDKLIDLQVFGLLGDADKTFVKSLTADYEVEVSMSTDNRVISHFGMYGDEAAEYLKGKDKQ